MSRTTPKFGFATMTALVTAALYAKENWDKRRRGASSSSPPAYDEDADPMTPYADAEGAPLMNDTESQTTFVRPRRQARKGWCVCCGLRCDLFCKALGIVVILYMIYGAFKFARYMLTPTPTGLEAMPAYSTSLGCTNAPFYFNGSPTKTQYGILVDPADAFSVILSGNGAGTVALAQGDEEGKVIVEMTAQTDDQSLLNKVLTDHGRKRLEDGHPGSFFNLATPFFVPEGSCLRFDITIYIPKNVARLHILSDALTHVQFLPQATSVKLDDLTIKMLSDKANNLVLPQVGIQAIKTTMSLRGGYLVGDIPLVDELDVNTRGGQAITKVRVIASDDAGSPNLLTTATGGGRSDFTYVSTSARQISSTHKSAGGDLYLTYKEASYNGVVDLKAKSYSAYNLQSTGNVRWKGSESGPDRITVETPGWVGLYF